MPELPEVEVARRAIEEHCVGKRIVQCSVADNPKVIDGVTPSNLESTLVGKTIVLALRMGKNLWLCLDSLPFPTFQFGMAGAIYTKGMTLTKYKRSACARISFAVLVGYICYLQTGDLEGIEKYSKRTVKHEVSMQCTALCKSDKVLEELRLTMDQFIDLCILSDVIIVIALKYDNACVVEYGVSAATVPCLCYLDLI
ncbi:hypothetical protein ZIOFF_065001 [Zingiber officinale]|uniref:Formamidopyrimidine-DNA glycosylase catalytic domain-containing protein n=1 Tax=Zingiber officinale TaxID=94328 RepID=A0A8J5KGT4_ZINOF|nr:hypothetical protein ZIOFF_065001 [Zingiber officinale]